MYFQSILSRTVISCRNQSIFTSYVKCFGFTLVRLQITAISLPHICVCFNHPSKCLDFWQNIQFHCNVLPIIEEEIYGFKCKIFRILSLIISASNIILYPYSCFLVKSIQFSLAFNHMHFPRVLRQNLADFFGLPAGTAIPQNPAHKNRVHFSLQPSAISTRVHPR